MTIGNKIESIRKLKKWSRTKLAKEAGVSRNTIHRIETGKEFSVLVLEKIAAALEFNITLSI